MRYKHRYSEDNKAKVRGDLIAFKLFNDYCYDGDFKKFTKNLHLMRGVIKKQVEYIKVFWDNGEHLGSYYDIGDQESIENKLDYISDRFNCQGRLRWLLELEEHLRKV